MASGLRQNGGYARVIRDMVIASAGSRLVRRAFSCAA
jgi:hypothetical protein